MVDQVNFWEFMLEGPYRQWKADELKREMWQTVQSGAGLSGEDLSEQQPHPFSQPPPDETADMGQIVTGAAPGFLTRARKKLEDITGDVTDTIGGALEAGTGATTSALRTGLDTGLAGMNWYSHHVANPIAGYGSYATQRVGGPLGLIPGGDLIGAGWSKVGLWNPEATQGYDLGGWENMGQQYRQHDMTGVQRVATDVAFDPLSYTGPAEKIPLLGKALTLPGEAVNRAISGVHTGADAVPGLRWMLGQSTSGAADDFGNALRAAAVQRKMGSVTPEAVDALAQAGAKLGYDKYNVLPLIDQVSKGTDPLKAYNVGRDLYRTTDNALTAAGRTGIGGGALNAVDAAIAGYKKVADPITSRAAQMILGTLGFPLFNYPEDVIRARNAGWSGAKMAPQELAARYGDIAAANGRLIEHNPLGLAQQAMGMTPKPGVSQAMGPGFNADFLSRVPGLNKVLDKAGFSGKVHPFDLMGPKYLRQSGEWTEPVRAGFYGEQIDKGIAEAQARGLTGQAAREEGARIANQVLEKTFPSYNTTSRLDVAARNVFPFWGYESGRPAFLARWAAEHPDQAAAFAHYMDNTDQGKISVPSETPGIGGYQVTPVAGTVWSGIPRTLKPDFPPYSQGKSGKLEEVTDALGRAGLFPSTPIMLGQAGFRAAEGEPAQLGSVIPGTAHLPAQLAETIGQIPGLRGVGEAAVRVEDIPAFNDRFREYRIRQVLAAQGINPEDATDRQRVDAAMEAGTKSLVNTETNVVNYRPPEQDRARAEMVREAIAHGVPQEVASDPTKNPITAADPRTGQRYLDAATVRDIYAAHPDWEGWNQVGTPLKPPAEQKRLEDIRGYNAQLERVRKWEEAQLGLINQNEVSGKAYRDRRSDIMAAAAAMRDQALEDFPGAKTTATPEARAQFYQQTGRTVSGPTAQDEAAQRYYAVRPQLDQNGIPDIASYRQQRASILAGMDPATQDYVQNRYRAGSGFSDAKVQEQENNYQTARKAYEELLAIPKYRGLTEDQAHLADTAAQQRQALSDMYPRASTEFINSKLRQINPEGANALRRAQGRHNPQRDRFLAQHPEVVWYLSSAPGLTDAGIAP